MKHAYLILAHHQFALLELLVRSLDHAGNGIFIHFDSKVTEIPAIAVQNAALYLIEERVDVRWGDLSVVEAEYVLFEEAFQTDHYDYFHLVSGVDMPIKSQEYIRQFFTAHSGAEFIGFYQGEVEQQIDRKVQRYHLFPKDFRLETTFSGFAKKILRAVFLRVQLILGIRRNQGVRFKKGTQWVSVSRNFVAYLLSYKEKVLNTYHHTYCPDEIYKQTLCWYSPFRERVYDLLNEGRSSLRMVGWKNGNLYDWEDKDFEKIMQSESVFARKFNTTNISVVHRIFTAINS